MRYHARWVLPITQPPIENGTVVESDGVITYVGPRSAAPPGDDYDLGDAILLPGLVNTHTHLELTAMRGFLENCRFTEWIDKLRQSRNEVMDQEALLDSARFGIVEGLEAGITTYADTCSSGVAMQAMRDAGVRGIMYQEVFGPDPSHAETAMRELEDRVNALRLEQTDLVSLGVSPHAPYTVSDPLYDAAARFANSHDLPLAMHIAESQAEFDLVTRGTGDFAEGWQRRGIHGLAAREIANRAARAARRAGARATAHPLRARGCGRHGNHGAAKLLGGTLPGIERQIRAWHRSSSPAPRRRDQSRHRLRFGSEQQPNGHSRRG